MYHLIAIAAALLLAGGCDDGKPDEEPTDTACARSEAQPLPPEEDRLDPPCGGEVTSIAVGPGASSMYVAFDDQGSCPELGDEAGFVHILDGADLSVTASIPWPETNAEGGEMDLAYVGLDPVFGLVRSSGGRDYANVEFYDPADGALLGTLEGGQEIAYNIEFAGSYLLTSQLYYDTNVGRVYVFEAPFAGTFDREDAVAIHDPPFDPCTGCLFGSPLAGLGDVTGDGVADVLVGGGGLWFLDGELVAVDQGVESALEVSAPTTALDATIAPVGDVDGDGLDDYATSARTSAYGPFGAVYVLRGAESEPFVEVYGSPERPDEQIGDSVTAIGDLDGDELGTMVILAEHGPDVDAPDRNDPSGAWLVEGPLRCGEHDISEVGTYMEGETGVSSAVFEGGDGLLVAPTFSLDSDASMVRVWRW